jgi:hypothetical protein
MMHSCCERLVVVMKNEFVLMSAEARTMTRSCMLLITAIAEEEWR